MNAGGLESYRGLRHAIVPRPELAALLDDMVRERDQGDRGRFERLRNRVVASMLRFVVQIAQRFRGRGVEAEDLVSIGALGLLRALETWRPGEAGIGTYARQWILQHVTRAIDDLGSVVRRPPHVQVVARKLARVRGEYREAHGREASVEELAQLARVSVAVVERSVARGPGTAISLDAPVELDDGEGDTNLDQLTDEDAPTAEDEAVLHQREAEARELLGAIPRERDRQIVAMRVGLNGYGGEMLSLEEVGRRFGLTRERARQIENAALERMAKRARQAEAKRTPSTNRATLRLVPSPPTVEALPELTPPGPPPRSAPRIRATVAGNAAALEAMREGGTDLAEMVRIERALDEAARARRARAKAAADAKQAARARAKREAEREQEVERRRRQAEALARTKSANRMRATSAGPA